MADLGFEAPEGEWIRMGREEGYRHAYQIGYEEGLQIGLEAAKPIGYELGIIYGGITRIKREPPIHDGSWKILDRISQAILSFKMDNSESSGSSSSSSSEQLDRIRAGLKELLSRHPQYAEYFERRDGVVRQSKKPIKLEF